MKNNTTVSVVVPIYNTERYLPQCLNSLVQQTLPGIEIILVDDGSTDCSKEICRQYADKYSFVKLIHQKNSGVTQALKTGMAAVTGEYYSFCGSDDFVDLNFYKRLYEAAQKSNADIAQCGYSMYYSDSDIVPFEERRVANAITKAKGNAEKVMDVLLLSPSLTVRRIHKTSLTKNYNIDFDSEIRIAEDLLFSCYTLLVAKKVVYVNQTGYFYRQNRDGRLSFIGDERALDILLVFGKLRDFIRLHKLKSYLAIAHLEINILLYQAERIEYKLRDNYFEKILADITCSKAFAYMISGYIFSVKVLFAKYFVLSFLCSCVLWGIVITKSLPFVAIPLLKMLLWLRQGNLLKRILNIK